MQKGIIAKTAAERAALLRACPASIRSTAAPILAAGWTPIVYMFRNGVHALIMEKGSISVHIQQDGRHRAQVHTIPATPLHVIGL